MTKKTRNIAIALLIAFGWFIVSTRAQDSVPCDPTIGQYKGVAIAPLSSLRVMVDVDAKSLQDVLQNTLVAGRVLDVIPQSDGRFIIVYQNPCEDSDT